MAREAAARAHAIFSRALELDGDQRDAMLREECGDDTDALQRVKRLLKSAEASEGFLETPAIAAQREPTPTAPDAVGTYLVIGVLGVGGMGTVYEAVQQNPNRRVAIKVMNHLMAHTDAQVRFRLEAETLARLRHPGIAQIYEAGTAQLGGDNPSPFIAMELIPNALSITRYAETHGLTLRQRLTMFAQVCDAVLHGHQNGIIHRDIKPANVLVGPDGLAKVIDFGIARSTEAGSPSLTADSDTSRIIGSLNSMSPEQCTDPANIDARSDVYSLGVILYELVTGRLPHDLSRCSIPQAVRIIAEETPPGAESFRAEAKGDLGAIIETATAKDRTRRYSGAGALAADVRRYLDHRPIEARRTGAFEHVRKFTRRNPPLAIAIGAASVLVLVSGVVSTILAYSAAKARDAAMQRERDLEISSQFQEAMLRDLDVMAMGDRLKESITAAIRGTIPAAPEGGEAAVNAALDDWNTLASRLNFTTLAVESFNVSVLQRYAASINDRLQGQPVLRARLLQQLAGTMNSLGLLAEALPVITQALELRRESLGEDHVDTLQSRHSVGSLLSSLGRYDEAERHLSEAYERSQRRLGPDHATTLNIGTSLGGVYRRTGDLKRAEQIWTDTLARQRRTLGDDDSRTLRTLNNVGVLYAVQGRLAEAEASWRELLGRRRRTLGEDNPEYRGSLGNLGVLLQDHGRFEEAMPLIREALASDRRVHGDEHPSTLVSMSMLGALLRETGDFAGAEALLRECHSGRASLLGPEHHDTLRTQVMLGAIVHARGASPQGEGMVLEALEIQIRTLGEEHADAVESLAALRDIARETDRLAEALELSTRVTTFARERSPQDALTLGSHLSSHGALLLAVERMDEARTALEEAYRLLAASLGAGHPKTRSAASRMAEYLSKTGQHEPHGKRQMEYEKWLRLSEKPRSSE